ncbi:uncharacterized protein DUF1217 [Aminobacter aminovorans]|uniref:Protein of uncharacterized function (DUF1217) n=1 Tax=Aminobacter aminovorans TaxID=83263 RepID=A0A380WKK1_AMIAI|nr:DUF1217 domain-containing protein [Aminobacter aminovorans]TCS28830.1 uncharacterized protein DUF1217 [Aminobacter aminovorans]SUU88684.1 Protein of uncharacterised function (DUF1217) [Aminobacter aminovorans]
MLNTYTSYHLITRDLGKALDRVENQPTVERDTEYYLKNITKVKSIDEFVKNDRLFRYAMKAHGLENMAYAKAFMVKALKEGVAKEDSFANKLTDKRYAEFVKSFNFAELGDKATVYTKAQQGAVDKYLIRVKLDGVDPNSEAVKKEVKYYLDNIVKVTSAKDLMADNRLYTFAMKSFGIEGSIPNKEMMEKVLAGGVRDPKSYANQMTDKRYAAFASTYNFEALGKDATTYNAAQRPSVDKYVRQTLEENAGKDNEGVRLALYFERKASSITSFYEVLADPALAKVVRTALGLPETFASANIDRQVKLFEDKLKIETFSNPKKLDEFLKRFTSLWEINNPSSPVQASVGTLFGSSSPAYGVSTDVLFAMQKLRF